MLDAEGKGQTWLQRGTEFVKNVWFLATVICSLVAALWMGAVNLNGFTSEVKSIRTDVDRLKLSSDPSIIKRLDNVEKRHDELDKRQDQLELRIGTIDTKLATIMADSKWIVETLKEIKEDARFARNDLERRP